MAAIILLSLAMIALAVALNRLHPVKDKSEKSNAAPGQVTGSSVSGRNTEDPGAPASEHDLFPPEPPEPTEDPTGDIATFLQGPKSWEGRLTWSGEWGEAWYDGGKFGGFGCGLCCMANLYTSLSPYECSPLDMYRYAKKISGYGGGGAIDWGYIKDTMKAAGFTSDVWRKPNTYKKFQKQVKTAMAVLVVVSSYDSTCFWQDTPGHYVTLFLYDSGTDRIFLADSGDPGHNRRWVPLKKIYRSLKTSNRWQYLAVTGYSEEADTWKHRGYGGVCLLPEGWEERQENQQ